MLEAVVEAVLRRFRQMGAREVICRRRAIPADGLLLVTGGSKMPYLD